MLVCNPARHIEITGYQQPHAKVWTEARVGSWEQTGALPAVAVWTADQLAGFLGSVNDDPLFALWWLAGLRGLRRGELCGLHWADIDLDRGTLTIERNRTTAGYEVIEGDPKTPAGWRAVALDKRSVQILRIHRRYRQDRRAETLENGKPWFDTGYVFTRRDGKPINPNYATTRFRLLVRRAGLPPVRLHDLRHGAAFLAHEAGADLKTLQDLLGHSSILVTADTYTSVLPQIQRCCADATAQLVLNAARRTRKKIKTKARKNRPTAAQNGQPQPGETENRCFHPGQTQVARKAPSQQAVSHDRRCSGGGTHVAPTRSMFHRHRRRTDARTHPGGHPSPSCGNGRSGTICCNPPATCARPLPPAGRTERDDRTGHLARSAADQCVVSFGYEQAAR
ncbi:site-specific integrase [Actinoplanes sp. Pm04-4]|uniref:Site-specific integrase n=1 Tax=Paractinoplanes pyxinae TaxID=2997416 RepID=A0ABT4BJD5_9ACTN|nr:site-specific integrase [Actinoplanes pyxinae]MCY1145723.1 site-specific integrase [Actinoplanes pyxinae]